ncbi:MAG: hypothetical protein BWK75_01550 [Candidatus Altiarchaeales archaeon A3]|nr:MAG: hypothetical protein BWK75_01550 [Candidatus Altiarchaeales archaeon A3]
MNNYPKIYSISTVGVRQHGNADFLLHPIRTDFTGDNGLGKSIIADLMQLIFIPLRDEWKPGTEGIKKEDRRIETIPLEREWIRHSYSFLNIEIRKNKFIVIGVFIPRNSRSPVRPFIIQKSDDFENRKNLVPFDKPLTFSDFLADNQQILDLKELERNLFQKYQIHFKDFFQQTQIEDYFDLLFRNQIIPIQLTIKSNLKSFAKILQSFSRGKTLDINKSSSMQNFLFEDNEEIKFNFDKERENLAGYIKEYNDHDREINLIDKKQKRLEELRLFHTSYESAKIEYLKNNALFNSNKYLVANKTFDDNQRKHTEASKKYTDAKKDYDKKTLELFKSLLEQKEICNEIRSQLDLQKAETGKENIEKLKKERDNNRDLIKELEKLKPLVDLYKTVEELQTKVSQQEKEHEEFKKLNLLKAIKLLAEFEKSKWKENYKEAYTDYISEKASINLQLEGLTALLELYEGNNPDSLFNWALNQKKALTLAEETVLMNFKSIFIKQIDASEGTKYTLTPKLLLSSFEEKPNGVWLKLGDIREFIPFISKQIFDNAQTLEKAIEKNKQEVKKEIEELQNDITAIDELHNQLQNIGYSNQEFVEIYKRRKEIDKFKLNNLLTSENLAFIKNNFRIFGDIENIKSKNEILDKHITDTISQTATIQQKIKTNNEIIVEVNADWVDVKKDNPDPIELSDLGLKILSFDSLEEKQTDYKNAIKILKSDKGSFSKTRETQKGIMDSAEGDKVRLKNEMDSAEKDYETARTKLHNETDLKFDSLLPLQHLTNEFIEQLKTDFETKEKDYTNGFIGVAEAFEDTKQEKMHPEIYLQDGKPNYGFQTLVNILCGKLGLEGLIPELNRLNEKQKEFGDLQLKILINVFEQVEKQYNEYHTTIIRLNDFFNNNKVSRIYKFKIEFTPRSDIGIDWIEKMKDEARVYKYGSTLFSPKFEGTPETLINDIAKKFYRSIDCNPIDLLNPKFYFNLSVRMENEEGKTNTGSGGQAYMALSLLCIGRLSIVQKQQDMPGVRFIIIEELSNIDDTNFNIFPQIANEFGYQLLTMTPKPFGSYTNEEWYLHMLVEGTDPDLNYTAMSFFKNKYEGVELKEHLASKNELERNKTT